MGDLIGGVWRAALGWIPEVQTLRAQVDFLSNEVTRLLSLNRQCAVEIVMLNGALVRMHVELAAALRGEPATGPPEWHPEHDTEPLTREQFEAWEDRRTELAAELPDATRTETDQ